MTIERWAYDGIVVSTGDRDEISLDELNVFVQEAAKAGHVSVRVFPYGLRATRVSGQGGPHLDWRD